MRLREDGLVECAEEERCGLEGESEREGEGFDGALRGLSLPAARFFCPGRPPLLLASFSCNDRAGAVLERETHPSCFSEAASRIELMSSVVCDTRLVPHGSSAGSSAIVTCHAFCSPRLLACH